MQVAAAHQEDVLRKIAGTASSANEQKPSTANFVSSAADGSYEEGTQPPEVVRKGGLSKVGVAPGSPRLLASFANT